MKQEVMHHNEMAMTSAGRYANHLNLAADSQPRQHLISQFFTGRMLFLTPKEQCQSTEGRFQGRGSWNRHQNIVHGNSLLQLILFDFV